MNDVLYVASEEILQNQLVELKNAGIVPMEVGYEHFRAVMTETQPVEIWPPGTPIEELLRREKDK